MLEGKLQQSVILKRMLEAVKDLCKEVNFDCDGEGIRLHAMDSSHVALVSMWLKECAFTDYKCDKHISLGINVESLSKIFKLCGVNDTVQIKAEEGTDRCTFIFESPEEDKFADFDLKLIDLDAESLTIPEQQYGCKVRMPSAEFQKICRDVTGFGDTAQISANKEWVKFTVNGEIGAGNVTVKPNRSERAPVTIEAKEPTAATFGLRFLNLFTKATPLCDEVVVKISDEFPMVIEYQLLEERYRHLRFYLAPKIDD